MSEQKTGIEEYFIIKDNKKLRCGYTTGTCAAAAAKAAAIMLLGGGEVRTVPLMTPKGILLQLEILDITRETDAVTCAVKKDAGDDPDVTDGILVYAKVSIPLNPCSGDIPGNGSRDQKTASERTEPMVSVDGGMGVGRVTREGMQQAVGEAAINPVPKRMIREAVEEIARDHEYFGRLDVEISIPAGVEIAKKTFNPRLGIEGGISVLGTSGIVVPMSEEALVASIRLEMEMLVKRGQQYLIITPGNYGETFTKQEMSIDLSASMKCSNFVGETLDMAVNLGVKGILFVAHIGKFIKVAGGIMNTHSRNADSRAELMAAFALRAGADKEIACALLDTITTDEGLAIMDAHGIREKAMQLAAERVHFYLQHRVGGALETEAILFSSQFGYLAQTAGTDEMLKHFTMRPGDDCR